MVVAAAVGAVGLVPTYRALEAGKDVALANKETLVMAGELMVAQSRAHGGRLLPIDSEHCALHQCLDGRAPHEVRRLVLTASGGPFRTRPRETFDRITPRGGALPSDLVDGPEDHDRLGDAHEQGARGDRGALAVRPAGRARGAC